MNKTVQGDMERPWSSASTLNYYANQEPAATVWFKINCKQGRSQLIRRGGSRPPPLKFIIRFPPFIFISPLFGRRTFKVLGLRALCNTLGVKFGALERLCIEL